ncbi:hypothetical protein TSAR_005901 [Trichomalopsis sarcophagae]|uniref:Uncharacterized protein n=1 Tax=Trichomalopsis sarcophagae TaxID=543379 RepID=A0A232FM05_9HYME|nr:hypothetical protein TSAR_005901 [Trichomalopsis sarcophagae]
MSESFPTTLLFGSVEYNVCKLSWKIVKTLMKASGRFQYFKCPLQINVRKISSNIAVSFCERCLEAFMKDCKNVEESFWKIPISFQYIF